MFLIFSEIFICLYRTHVMLEYVVFCMIFQKNNYLISFILVKKYTNRQKKYISFLGKTLKPNFNGFSLMNIN